MSRDAAWALVAILAGTTLVGSSQVQPQPRPSFRGGTELVQVDVVVTDTAGQPVIGLTAADFTLLDRKKPQPIEVFDEIAHSRSPNPFSALPASVPLDVADNRGTQANRLVILLLDDLNTWQGRTERVRALARRVIADLGSEASMAVLFTSGDHGTEITSNRAALFAEIEKFKGWHRLPYRASAPKCGGVNWDVDRIHKTMQDVSRMLGMEVTRRKRSSSCPKV